MECHQKIILYICTTKFLVAEVVVGYYNPIRWTCKPSEDYFLNSNQTCKPPELHTIMKKCNGTGLVLKICETKNNVWKRYEISIQNSIGNYIEITKIKPNFASLNKGQKCRKPVFMRVSGICFIKWLWFGSICGESNGVISFEKVNKKGRRYKLCCQQEKKH